MADFKVTSCMKCYACRFSWFGARFGSLLRVMVVKSNYLQKISKTDIVDYLVIAAPIEQ